MVPSAISFELQEAAFNGLQRGERALSSALGRTARDSKGRLPWNALWPGPAGVELPQKIQWSIVLT